MTKKQKNEMISFFKEMDAKIEAKEKKQQKLAEINPEFPTKKTFENVRKVALEAV